MYIYHLITIFAYLFVLFLFTIFLFAIHLFTILAFVIPLFRIILITICYLFISGSLFRIYLFRLYLFRVHYFAFKQLLFRCKKNSPLFRVRSRSVMRTTVTWGGKLLTLGEFQSISILIWNREGRLCDWLVFTSMLVEPTQPLNGINLERIALLCYVNTIRCISHTLLC